MNNNIFGTLQHKFEYDSSGRLCAFNLLYMVNIINYLPFEPTKGFYFFKGVGHEIFFPVN